MALLHICRIDKDLVIKVADFGLSRDIHSDDYYRMGHKAKIPIKWMPPESIHDRYYNQQTDVVCNVCTNLACTLLSCSKKGVEVAIKLVSKYLCIDAMI